MSSGLRKQGRTFSDFGPRVSSSVVLAAIALVVLWMGGVAFALFWLAAALAVLWEWQMLVGEAHRRPRFLAGAVGVSAAAAFATYVALGLACLTLIAAAALLASFAQRSDRVLAGAGALYAGALATSAIALRQSDGFGLLAIAWLFAVVWGTDVMAYFGGRLLGGPKLCPPISPGKTWSGTLVGILSGALVGLGVVALDPQPREMPALFCLGLLLAAISQAGDLAESALKRRFGVKDSGALIPGHGGVMDRLDGFIAASVCAALIGAFREYPFIAAGLISW